MKWIKKFSAIAFLMLFGLCLITDASQAQSRSLGSLLQLDEATHNQQLKKGMSLKQALNRIENQRGVTFLYRANILKGKKIAEDVVLSDDIDQLLKEIFESIDFNVVKLNARSYGISRKGHPYKDIALQEDISGAVTDAESGETLPGVNIRVKGTSAGTATDAQGQYELTVESLQDTLVFSYVGYATKNVPINGRNTVNIKLQTSTFSAEELVVVGYGTQQRKDLTGAVSTVDAEEFENKPVSDINEALQGKVAGVQITSNSGSPGSSKTVRIRGTGTLGDSDPLYVVDGNPVANSQAFNPEDVKSIEVLKDASSAAIYGSRGANGVVLITTKDGTAGESQVSFNMYSGFQEVPKMLDMTNATEWAQVYNQTLINAGQEPAVEDPSSLGVGTDWQEEIFRTAPVGNYNLSFSGGNETTTYRVSGGYFLQKGTVTNSSYRRANFAINADHDVKPWLTFGEKFNFTYSKRNSLNDLNQFASPLKAAIQADPTFPVRNENGDFAASEYSATENPVAQLTYQNPELNSRNLIGNVYGIIEPIDGLSVKSQFNVSFYNGHSYDFRPDFFISNLQQNSPSSLQETASENVNWEWRNTATYQFQYDKSQFKVLGGISTQSNKGTSLFGSGGTLPTAASQNTSLRYLSLATTGLNTSSGAGEYTILSYFGRLNYNYDERYLLEATLRRDGSSKFGANNRFGTFPSVSVGWNIANEDFMSDFDNLSQLKLRGSYGEIGNQNALANYAFISTLTSNIPFPLGSPDSPYLGKTPSSIGNPDLKWETVKEWNLGVDVGLFQDRLSFTANYYDRQTTDLLVQLPIPDLAGIPTAPFTNGGDIVNKGFEFSAGYSNTTDGGFYYSLSGNLATLDNEVTRLANQGASFASGFIQGANMSRTAVGQPIASYYGYVTDGIFQNWDEVYNHATQNQDAGGGRDAPTAMSSTAPGDLRFKDLNNDGVISTDDQTFLGSPSPSLTYGASGNFAYKNIDLAFSLIGESGNDVYAGWKYQTASVSKFYNYYAPEMLGAWDGEGSTNSNPRLITTDPNNNSRVSDQFVEDASYLKLRNLQLGYTLPQEVLGSLSINKLRIYANVQNLFTITGYDGFDPSVGTNTTRGALDRGIDLARYPQSRIFTLGLNLTF